ncbi:hypothetical protein [Nevskia soli]|uniref:hypothetical protein n=1 Tax=Nevskia soli TaxID=418856 RepID=UPI0012F9747B|nr:hypothetical protein [Nevskia soli]
MKETRKPGASEGAAKAADGNSSMESGDSPDALAPMPRSYGVVRKFSPAAANDTVSPPPGPAKGDDDLMSQGKKPS